MWEMRLLLKTITLGGGHAKLSSHDQPQFNLPLMSQRYAGDYLRVTRGSQGKTVFKKKWNVKIHIRSFHLMEKPFKCPRPGCGKKYTRNHELKKHYRKSGHGMVSGHV